MRRTAAFWIQTATLGGLCLHLGSATAFAYNPAAMGFHDRGALFIGPSLSVDTATGSHDSAGADWTTAPLFQAALRVHDQWRVGLGINAPFGLETRWEPGPSPS